MYLFIDLHEVLIPILHTISYNLRVFVFAHSLESFFQRACVSTNHPRRFSTSPATGGAESIPREFEDATDPLG